MAFKTQTFLRRADREDLDTVVAWMEDPDFLRFLYGDPARSPKQIRENIVSLLGRTQAQSLPRSIYLVIDSKEFGPIGLVSLQSISWRNRSCAIDLYIGNKELRKGIVVGISMYRVFEYCFNELNLHRVSSYIYSFNEASWRFMESAGALRELTLHEHVARDGKLHDLYCYGMLPAEFEACRKRYAKFEAASLASMIRAQEKDAATAEHAP